MSVKLNDLLRIADLSNVKIRLNLSNGSYNAINNYNNNKEGLLIGNFYNSENRKWFNEGEIVIGLAQIDGDEWLLFDISTITKDHNQLGYPDAGLYDFYNHEPVKEYENLFGRVIVKFHKDNAYVTLKAENHIDRFEVLEVLRDSFGKNNTFPGYKNVSVSYSELKNKLDKSKEWRNMLKCRKGVYVITDIETGKLYIGSAYGEDGIYGRWRTYMVSGFDKAKNENGQYPNKKFQELVQEKGIAYIQKNFRYTLLETYTEDMPDEQIIQRENYWKKALRTRKFGYNEN